MLLFMRTKVSVHLRTPMVPIFPAFYFGSVEHYALLGRCTHALVDIGEHYERQSYRTRTTILGPNGSQHLNVQIARDHGRKMPMHTVELSYAESWPQQHLHAIRSAYGQTPWFIHYIDDIEAVLTTRHNRLVDLNLATLKLGMKWLGLVPTLEISDGYVVLQDGCWQATDGNTRQLLSPKASTPMDLRNQLHPKKPLPTDVPPTRAYPQVFADRHGFVPRLSVIDLVCNSGPEARRFVVGG